MCHPCRRDNWSLSWSDIRTGRISPPVPLASASQQLISLHPAPDALDGSQTTSQAWSRRHKRHHTSTPPSLPHCRRPPREGRETKGKERNRPQSQMCNPSRSFFFVLWSQIALLPERCQKIWKLYRPILGRLVARAPNPKLIAGCLRTFSVRRVRRVISGIRPGTHGVISGLENRTEKAKRAGTEMCNPALAFSFF